MEQLISSVIQISENVIAIHGDTKGTWTTRPTSLVDTLNKDVADAMLHTLSTQLLMKQGF
jgi:hypothetical protein